MEPAEKTPKKRQNRANLLIMVSSRFQRSIQVEWPAKTQETEFGAIRSRVSAGQRRLGVGRKHAKSCSREQNWGNLVILVCFRFQHPDSGEMACKKPKKPSLVQFGPGVSEGQRRLGVGRKNAKSCSNEQNWGNLVILVFFRFQHPIPVKWPAKAQETEFGAIRSRGKRRAASSWSQPKKTPKKRQNRANLLIMVSIRFPTPDSGGMGLQKHRKPSLVQFGPEVSAGQRRLGVGRKNAKSCSREQNWGNLVILVCFRFQHPIPVKWPAKAQETEFGAIRSRGKRRAASSWSQLKKRQKNAQNRANLLIMVSSRFQRSIQVEWPAKTQETDFGAIRSRGKRRTASSWSRPKTRQKLLQGAKLG